MKRIILIILVVCISLVSFSQSKTVSMTIDKVAFNSTSIEIRLGLTNDSVIGLTIAKPEIYYTCCFILHICFEDFVNGEKFDCRPCLEITDLESINIDYLNGVYLNPYESFQNTIKIDKRFTKYLRPGRQYYLKIAYDFNGVNINSEMKDIFRGSINSNRVLVKYE
jgi:hypothetical protein